MTSPSTIESDLSVHRFSHRAGHEHLPRARHPVQAPDPGHSPVLCPMARIARQSKIPTSGSSTQRDDELHLTPGTPAVRNEPCSSGPLLTIPLTATTTMGSP